MEKRSEDRLSESARAAVRSFAESERQSGHPSAEELVGYHTDELSDEASAVIREHLALCHECTGVVLDLARFEELQPPTEADQLSDDDVALLKRSLDDRLQAEGLSGGALEPATSTDVPVPVRQVVPPLYWGAMAALLLVALGLGLRSGPALPGGSPELFALYPETSRSTGQETLRLPPWADSYILILGSVGSDQHRAVRLELRDANGGLVLLVESLPRSGEGTFNYSLARDRLPPGVYEARLFGLASEPPEPLDAYTFQLVFDG